MIIRNLLLTIIALLVTGCMTVVPTQLPPEGTTATTTSEVRTVTRTITNPTARYVLGTQALVSAQK